MVLSRFPGREPTLKEQRLNFAYHEAGHVLMHLLEDNGSHLVHAYISTFGERMKRIFPKDWLDKLPFEFCDGTVVRSYRDTPLTLCDKLRIFVKSRIHWRAVEDKELPNVAPPDLSLDEQVGRLAMALAGVAANRALAGEDEETGGYSDWWEAFCVFVTYFDYDEITAHRAIQSFEKNMKLFFDDPMVIKVLESVSSYLLNNSWRIDDDLEGHIRIWITEKCGVTLGEWEYVKRLYRSFCVDMIDFYS